MVDIDLDDFFDEVAKPPTDDKFELSITFKTETEYKAVMDKLVSFSKDLDKAILKALKIK